MSNKKKKIKTRHNGKWFIPKGKLHLEGELVIDNEKSIIKLRIFTDKDFFGRDITHNFDNQIIIFGHCEFDSKITLNNCVLRSASPVGDTLYELNYEPEICYYGAIFPDSENIKISQLTCTFPYFSSWYDTNRIYFGTLSSDSSIAPYEPALKHSELSDEIKINDDLKIIVERRYEDFNLPLTTEVKFKVEHLVHFVSDTPKSLKEFRKHANSLLQLIKLSVGRLLYADFKSLIVHKDETLEFDNHFLGKEDKVLVSITKFNSIQKRQIISSDYIHQNDMLFCGGLRKSNRLKLIIVKWYQNFDEYSPLYNTFLDTLEWFQNTDAFLTEVMFNNRIVNLVQGIEYYYSISEPNRTQTKQSELKSKLEKIIEKIPEKEDRLFIENHIQYHEVLRHKLKFLLFEKFDLISNEIFKNKEDKKGYIHKIKEFRDKLSHGELIETSTGKIYDYYYKTLILLISCILETLDLSQSEIKNSLINTLKYSRIIQTIKIKMTNE